MYYVLYYIAGNEHVHPICLIPAKFYYSFCSVCHWSIILSNCNICYLYHRLYPCFLPIWLTETLLCHNSENYKFDLFCLGNRKAEENADQFIRYSSSKLSNNLQESGQSQAQIRHRYLQTVEHRLGINWSQLGQKPGISFSKASLVMSQTQKKTKNDYFTRNKESRGACKQRQTQKKY